MGKVRTVLGDIDSETLGVTNMHDHLLISAGVGVMKEPDIHLDSVDKACQELELFKAAGGRAVVDMMPVATGRDAPGLVEVSRRTGVHIVACSGFHQVQYYTPDHWVYTYPLDAIVDLFIADVTVGMDRYDYRGPIVERISAKAGVLKAATEYHTVPAKTERLFEAVAMAHLATGVPISTHTTYGTMALEQVELFVKYGVDPSAVIIGHLDRNMDFAYHKAVAETGAMVLYDGPSRVKYYPDSALVELICRMVDAGFGGQIVLGNDLARRSYRVSYGGGPGMGYLLNTFVPRLRAAGLGEDDIHRIFVANPSKALSLREVKLHG